MSMWAGTWEEASEWPNTGTAIIDNVNIVPVAHSTSLPAVLRAPAQPIVTDHQAVSVHTNDGIQLYQFLGDAIVSLAWSREAREVSTCKLTVAAEVEYARLPDLTPWKHWVSVWDENGTDLYWSGPITKVTMSRDEVVIEARDLMALLTRTRVPLTKRWEMTDPARIAEELLDSLLSLHNINAAAIVRDDPLGDRFDHGVIADTEMLDVAFDTLVNLGLRWTVVAGTPILGPAPRTVLAAFGENDFVGTGMTVVRDGTKSFNDVLLRGGDALARTRAPMAGLTLQTIVNIDSMFGVGNVDRAVKQYARYVSAIRDMVELPEGAVLHPDAPVTIDQLIPSARFAVDAFGMIVQMELVGVDVNYSAGTSAVAIRMEAVDDELPELVEIEARGAGA